MSSLSKFVLITTLLLSNNLNIVYSAGCSDDSTGSYTFVDNAVYGCDGIWVDFGVLNGEYLCGDGYSVCDDTEYAELLGLTFELCVSTNINDNTYYVSGLSSDGSLNCETEGSNDLFGCGSSGNDDTPWLYFSDTISCGPFGAQLSSDSSGNGDGAWTYGWEVWNNGDGTDEFDQCTHIDKGDDTKGGIMCCKDGVDFDGTMSWAFLNGSMVDMDIDPPDEDNANMYRLTKPWLLLCMSLIILFGLN